MSDPSSDTSTQLNNDLYADDNYSSTINFNATSGISNPSANVIKIFTNNIDASTIDEKRRFSCRELHNSIYEYFRNNVIVNLIQ